MDQEEVALNNIGEFLNGLSAVDTIAVAMDIALYGNAFTSDKKRIPPEEWPAIVERHNARPISDGVKGMEFLQ